MTLRKYFAILMACIVLCVGCSSAKAEQTTPAQADTAEQTTPAQADTAEQAAPAQADTAEQAAPAQADTAEQAATTVVFEDGYKIKIIRLENDFKVIREDGFETYFEGAVNVLPQIPNQQEVQLNELPEDWRNLLTGIRKFPSQ